MTEHFRQAGHGLRVEKIGNVVQHMELAGDGIHPFLVGHAENINADTASHVDVIFSLFIYEMGAFSFHKAYGISGIGMGYIGSIFFFCIHSESPL